MFDSLNDEDPFKPVQFITKRFEMSTRQRRIPKGTKLPFDNTPKIPDDATQRMNNYIVSTLKQGVEVARARPKTTGTVLAVFAVAGKLLYDFLTNGVRPTLQAIKEMVEYYDIVKRALGSNDTSSGLNLKVERPTKEMINDAEKVIEDMINISQGENIVDSVKEIANILDKRLNLNLPKFENIETLTNVAHLFTDGLLGQQRVTELQDDIGRGEDLLNTDNYRPYNYRKDYKQNVLLPDTLMKSSIQRGGTTFGVPNSGATESLNKIRSLPLGKKVSV